jgi:hypothetical protein
MGVESQEVSDFFPKTPNSIPDVRSFYKTLNVSWIPITFSFTEHR